MSALSDWWYDFKLERRITAVRNRCTKLLAERRYNEARGEFDALRLLCSQRRAEHVARMEQARGLTR